MGNGFIHFGCEILMHKRSKAWPIDLEDKSRRPIDDMSKNSGNPSQWVDSRRFIQTAKLGSTKSPRRRLQTIGDMFQTFSQ